MELSGFDAPHEAERGRCLRASVSDGGSGPEDERIPEERVHDLVNAAADRGGDAGVRGRYKLLNRVEPLQRVDLEQDPREERDLADTQPQVVAQLATEFGRIRRENERRRARREDRRGTSILSDVGEETLKQFQAIGYVE